jgi:hypothetical protein
MPLCASNALLRNRADIDSWSASKLVGYLAIPAIKFPNDGVIQLRMYRCCICSTGTVLGLIHEPQVLLCLCSDEDPKVKHQNWMIWNTYCSNSNCTCRKNGPRGMLYKNHIQDLIVICQYVHEWLKISILGWASFLLGSNPIPTFPP